jgi:HAD superfamily hydrolase (TIGR01509 family)
VTSDTTQTDLVAEETETETDKLRKLITGARVVLWDFDGPICRLFAGHSAERVATDLVEWLEGRGLHGLLTEAERESLDPHVVLRAVDRRHPGSDLVAELEERLTQEELRATSSAMPTAYADPLIRTWTAVGSRLAIATNNSPRVVRRYLAGRGLESCFAPHIYGRTQDLHQLKPDPHCLNRALNAVGAAPSAALMIGDSPSDHEAAHRAGVPFLGYARNERKAKLLREAGADLVVGSLEPLLPMLRALRA